MNTIILNEINISPLLKAQNNFINYQVDMITDRDKAGAVQAFEYSFELCWKILKRVLKSRFLEVNSPKSVFREAAKEKLIPDPEVWFTFQELRNKTSHTYNEHILEEIIAAFPEFTKELNTLIKVLKNLK